GIHRRDWLSLSQIKSGHIDDGDRRGSGGRQYSGPARRREGPAHPCSMTNECAWSCSNLCTTAERGADGVRRIPLYDRCIPRDVSWPCMTLCPFRKHALSRG